MLTYSKQWKMSVVGSKSDDEVDENEQVDESEADEDVDEVDKVDEVDEVDESEDVDTKKGIKSLWSRFRWKKLMKRSLIRFRRMLTSIFVLKFT